MGSLFRSEEMSLIQLYIPAEAAQPTVSELGELGMVQFRDLNPDVNAFQRSFVNEIRRCDDMERKLRFLSSQCEKADISVRRSVLLEIPRNRTVQEIDELAEQLTELETKLTQMNVSQEALKRRLLELTEMQHVLVQTGVFFQEAETHYDDFSGAREEDTAAPLLNEDENRRNSRDGQVRFEFVAGVVPRAKLNSFERVLWRALRGNLFLKKADINEPIRDPATDELVTKSVFIIFAHGKELLAKIRKICESLGATIYPIDDSNEKRQVATMEVASRLSELNNVISTTNLTRRAELGKVAETLDSWITSVKKEKAIYYTMNLFNFDNTRKCLIAEGWVPTNSIGDVQKSLRTAMERSGTLVPSVLNVIQTSKQPPTYHKTNSFTAGFQAIVDAYGVARYREANPAPYTIITFPFLFAVMFGDFGHGFIMFLAAAYLVLNEKKFLKASYGEIFEMIFGGRYIILLMGFFSMITGIIYNDVFSLSFNINPSGWEFPEPPFPNGTSLVTASATEDRYAIGIDHGWHGADNQLLFSNSYKMKMSIVFGVIHMSCGIFMQVFNHLHFKREYAIYLEFIPQMLFMQSIFGYLVFTIIYKWSVDWFSISQQPPNLLNMLIKMFMSIGTVEEPLFSGQAGLQVFLVIVAVICVPWMLLAKPFYVNHLHKMKLRANPTIDDHSDGHEEGGAVQIHDDSNDGGHDGHDEFDFSEIMTHQAIHTIEFCLGCISNTASYLRLWALSLAHAQLSDVLWTMIMGSVFTLAKDSGASFIFLFVAFGVWFPMTVFILIIMEGLSAFLHALRLHWVEFNGKFYEGSGRAFEPFSFGKILAEASAE